MSIVKNIYPQITQIHADSRRFTQIKNNNLTNKPRVIDGFNLCNLCNLCNLRISLVLGLLIMGNLIQSIRGSGFI